MSVDTKRKLRKLVHDANNHLAVLYGTLSLIDKKQDINRLIKQKNILISQTNKLIKITKEIGSNVKDNL